MIFTAMCFVLAAVIAWSTAKQAARLWRELHAPPVGRISRRARRRVREVIRRSECMACSERVPTELCTAYGKDDAGATLFLCPDCKALFERPRK